MIRKIRRIRACLLFGVGFLSFLPDALEARPLSVGVMSASPAQEIKKLQPLARYLERQLSSSGIDRVKVVIAKSIPQMIDLMRKKQVDLFLGGPFSSVAVNRFTDSRMVLQGGKEGSDKHSSVIFVRKDSGLKRLRDLTGDTVAFDSPFSTFGYWMPKMLLMDKGYPLTLKKGFSEKVGPDEIGYLFSHDDENTVLWVKKGKVKAGAIDQILYQYEDKSSPNTFRVLEKTVSLPPRIVSLRKNLSAPLSGKIEEILRGMDESEEGRKVLKEWNDTPRFETFSYRALEPLFKTGDWIHSEIKRHPR